MTTLKPRAYRSRFKEMLDIFSSASLGIQGFASPLQGRIHRRELQEAGSVRVRGLARCAGMKDRTCMESPRNDSAALLMASSVTCPTLV
eukprot:scaffold1741_cov262-Pinguiococcus_pyrenoidosus.AAC.30